MKTFHPLFLNSRDSISTGKHASLHYKAKRTTGNHSIEISHFPMGNSFLISCMNRSTNLLHILSLHIRHCYTNQQKTKSSLLSTKSDFQQILQIPMIMRFLFPLFLCACSVIPRIPSLSYISWILFPIFSFFIIIHFILWILRLQVYYYHA